MKKILFFSFKLSLIFGYFSLFVKLFLVEKIFIFWKNAFAKQENSWKKGIIVKKLVHSNIKYTKVGIVHVIVVGPSNLREFQLLTHQVI